MGDWNAIGRQITDRRFLPNRAIATHNKAAPRNQANNKQQRRPNP
jgi:hypothetical protein